MRKRYSDIIGEKFFIDNLPRFDRSTERKAITLGEVRREEVILSDGSNSLISDWDVGAGKSIIVEKLRARSSNGLEVQDVSHNTCIIVVNGRVGIGTTMPNAGAILDLSSQSKAFLPPRMTTAERDTISPTVGMIIYNTTTNKLNLYDGSSWKELVTS